MDEKKLDQGVRLGSTAWLVPLSRRRYEDHSEIAYNQQWIPPESFLPEAALGQASAGPSSEADSFIPLFITTGWSTPSYIFHFTLRSKKERVLPQYPKYPSAERPPEGEDSGGIIRSQDGDRSYV